MLLLYDNYYALKGFTSIDLPLKSAYVRYHNCRWPSENIGETKQANILPKLTEIFSAPAPAFSEINKYYKPITYSIIF